MINFNKGKEVASRYSGSENKKAIIYNSELYMIKFPDPIREKNNELSYKNNHFSEYVGCHIFNSCGIHTQETYLGSFTLDSGEEKIVVGCKDFTQTGYELSEFSKFAKAIIGEEKKNKAFIENIYDVVKESKIITNKEETIKSFWDMFVIDALIGNTDRHLSNWGFLVKGDHVSFAPVYDCGSSLGATISDKDMMLILNDSSKFKNTEFNLTSAYSMNGKRVFYHEIFKNPPEDLKEAIKRMVPKINISEINGIISSIEIMSNVRKEYILRAVSMRYKEILEPSFERISNKSISQLGKLKNLEAKVEKGVGDKPLDKELE